MLGVFLAYAHTDCEKRAAEIRDRFAREAPDIAIKQDRLVLEVESVGGNRSPMPSMRSSFLSCW
jgi:hypothetical protein